jgi:hypothetical protein
MRVTLGVFGLLLATGLSIPANAQAPPPGSYQQSCREIRMHGPTLTAICRTAKGRGEQPTALNVAHCVGDIGNNNGNLVCSGGQPAAPGYPGPGYGAGSRSSRAGIRAATALQRRGVLWGPVPETAPRRARDPRQVGLHALWRGARKAAIQPRSNPGRARTVLAPLTEERSQCWRQPRIRLSCGSWDRACRRGAARPATRAGPAAAACCQ